MRVAMISEHANPLADPGAEDAGGQNVYVRAAASELGRRGLEVTVYTRRDNPQAAERVPMDKDLQNVSVVHVSAGPAAHVPKDEMLPYMDEFADRIAEHWQADRPDVVHSHFWMSGYAALRALDIMGSHIPVVQSYHALGTVKHRHQGKQDTSPPQRQDIERQIGREADAILASCSDESEELVSMGVDPQKMHIVPGGIDVSLFAGERQFRTRRSGEAPTILSIGRLVNRKGVGTIIEAMKYLPECKLSIAGGPDLQHIDSDPDAKRLRAIAEKFGVTENVRFLGRVARHEVCRVMRSADAIVAVPWYEPFGIVPVEAMASGTPLVASRVGGMIDSVIDGHTGFLVPPRDPSALAEGLKMVLFDPELSQRIGTAAAQHARTNFSWHRVATLTENVYAQLIA